MAQTEEAADVANVPARHTEQAEEPLLEVNIPTAHAMQPVMIEYWPAGHGKQADAPPADEAPEAQLAHTEAANALYVPEGQEEQLDAPVAA